MASPGDVTRLVYEQDIRELQETLKAYLAYKDGVWILIDNLDKSWPVNRASREDILIIRSLMEATRKLQRQLEHNEVECRTIVFIRNDIYEHLLNETPDKGKDTAVLLDWTDEQIFKDLIHRRMMSSTKIELPFDEMWPMFFEAYIKGEHSFSYILSRTMLRPRDLISFLRLCVNVAVNRGNNKVQEADILQAEKTYSEDQLQGIFDELRDINSDFAVIPYAFIGVPIHMRRTGLEKRLLDAGILPDRFDEATKLLLWFGFRGWWALMGRRDMPTCTSMELRGCSGNPRAETTFVIHPAFRSVLLCTN